MSPLSLCMCVSTGDTKSNMTLEFEQKGRNKPNHKLLLLMKEILTPLMWNPDPIDVES